MTRYISLPHVIGLVTAVLALSFNLYIGDHRKSPIAKGVASELTIPGAPDNAASPTDGSNLGSSNLGVSNTRNVWFYLEGMCILGKDNVVSDCTKTCGATLPSNAATATQACWIPYTSSDLSVVGKCENVVLSKRTAASGDRAAFLGTDLEVPTFTPGDARITIEGSKVDKLACAIAGCDGETLVTKTVEDGATPVAGKCKEYGTVPTKTVAASTGAATDLRLAGLQKGFLYKQTKDLHLSINILEAKPGVGTTNDLRAKTTAQHVFDVYKYPIDYHNGGINFWLFTLISAIAMLLGALLVLFSKMWTAGKYGGEQLGTPSRYWLSTGLDVAHIIFLVMNMVFAGMLGMMFKTTIDGSMADATLEKLFWTSPILLFIGQLWVTMHGIAFSAQWYRNRQTDPYNNGVHLAVKKVVIADHDMGQRASMVRNNLNV